jgi:hypothetical protein
MPSSETYHVRANCKIRHEVAYDYDERRGIYLRRLESEEDVPNLILDGGRVAIHTYVYGTAAQRVSAGLGTGFNFIALTNNSSPPASGDTALSGELSGNGLTRAQGTVTLPTGSGTTTTVEKVFTYSGGSPQGVQKTALFDAASSGKMAHEILFTQRTLNTSDTLTLTFSITAT